jgi:hypothetical protein
VGVATATGQAHAHGNGGAGHAPWEGQGTGAAPPFWLRRPRWASAPTARGERPSLSLPPRGRRGPAGCPSLPGCDTPRRSEIRRLLGLASKIAQPGKRGVVQDARLRSSRWPSMEDRCVPVRGTPLRDRRRGPRADPAAALELVGKRRLHDERPDHHLAVPALVHPSCRAHSPRVRCCRGSRQSSSVGLLVTVLPDGAAPTRGHQQAAACDE